MIGRGERGEKEAREGCGRDGSALVQHLKGCAEIWGRNVEEEHSRYRGARKQYLFRLQEIVAGVRG